MHVLMVALPTSVSPGVSPPTARTTKSTEDHPRRSRRVLLNASEAGGNSRRVDDGVWANVPAVSAFVQQQPNEGAEASERTGIRFLIDTQHLYVGVICFDSEPQNLVVVRVDGMPIWVTPTRFASSRPLQRRPECLRVRDQSGSPSSTTVG